MAGGVHGIGACMARVMNARGHVKQGACMIWGCAWQGGHAWQGHVWRGVCVAGEMATTADSTHPTGMQSCFKCIFVTLFTWCDCNLYANIDTCTSQSHRMGMEPIHV